MVALLSAAFLLLQTPTPQTPTPQAPATQTPAAVDHSGEALLKKIFATTGEIRGTRLLVTKSNRTAGGIYLEDSTLDIWVGAANQIRIESMSTMGDSTVTVTDGTVNMADPLSDDDPVRLTKATGKLEDLSPREPLLFFLAGPSAYDRLVDADKAITLLPSGDAVEFRSKTFGKMVVGAAPSGLVSRVEQYQTFRRRDGASESEFAVSIEAIRPFGAAKPWPGCFSVTPAKGRKVQDDRAAKPVSST